MVSSTSESKEATYRIGAVSRLTGIPADTLRVWERRYSVVEPGRAEGRFRLYTRDDISRLALIKQLVDAGNAIGSVAGLSFDQLQERLETYGYRGLGVVSEKEGPCKVAILGDTLPARISAVTEELQGLEVVMAARERGDFESRVREQMPDVIILEYPTINNQTVTEVMRLLQRSNAKQAVVIFGFAGHEAARRLNTAQVVTMRAPVSFPELRRACFGLIPSATIPSVKGLITTGPIPPRRYDNETLGKIAVASTTIKCECPHHLADLIASLSAFETYSAECESTSREDAALHAHLHATTANARLLLEDVLAELVEAERLKI